MAVVNLVKLAEDIKEKENLKLREMLIANGIDPDTGKKPEHSESDLSNTVSDHENILKKNS